MTEYQRAGRRRMSGKLIRPGHICEPPYGQERGAVWRCDCGRYWQRYDLSWLSMSFLDRLLFRALHR